MKELYINKIQEKIPLLMGSFHRGTGAALLLSFVPGSGEPGISQLLSWFTFC